jgi:transposase
VPAALLGLTFYRSACRPVPSLRCGSKEARALSTRIRSAHLGFHHRERHQLHDHHHRDRPHKGSHTAVAIDSNEHVLDEIRVRSCSTQTVRLRDWAERFEERTWAVESAHGLGYLLAQQLVAAGEHVIDVPPVRAARVRVLGSGKSQKNDPNDARSIAIAALRAEDLATVCADDHSRVLKLLSKRHRDLGRLKNKASCRLHALLLEVVPGDASFRITSVTRVNAVIDDFEPADAMGRQRQEIAREFAVDIDRYNQLLDASKQRINAALAASSTSLTTICGVGPITAAMIIGQSGNIERFASKHHFASYNATAPVEASSGSKVRHRLNQRGNRQLNWAIYVVAISQLRHDNLGRAYFDRKVAEGKTSKEAIRALKRRISDVVYRHLVADARQQS